MSDNRAYYEQAALARYLQGLGFETLVLPEGLPKRTPANGATAKNAQELADARPNQSDRTKSDRATRTEHAATHRATGNRASGSVASGNRASGSRQAGNHAPSSARGVVGVDPEPPFEIDTGLDPGSRAACLDEISSVATGCVSCALSQKRNRVVFGSGNPDAELLLVGEGPGAREDMEGLPFVGPAGELLTQMLGAIDFERSQVYIANVVKCRPPGNRDPKLEEVVACSRFLKAQVQLIQPRMILALGRVAAQALLATSKPLGRLRGHWHSYADVPVWVTYHPAALLRNAGYKRPAWEDLQFVRDRLAQAGEVNSSSSPEG